MLQFFIQMFVKTIDKDLNIRYNLSIVNKGGNIW